MDDLLENIVKVRKEAGSKIYRSLFHDDGMPIVHEDVEKGVLVAKNDVLLHIEKLKKVLIMYLNKYVFKYLPSEISEVILLLIHKKVEKTEVVVDDIFNKVASYLARNSLDARFIEHGYEIYKKQHIIYTLQNILNNIFFELENYIAVDGKNANLSLFIENELARFVLFFGDNNKLKTTNKLSGQDAGDKLLVAVAKIFDAIVSGENGENYFLVQNICHFLKVHHIKISLAFNIGGDEWLLIAEKEDGKFEHGLSVELEMLIQDAMQYLNQMSSDFVDFSKKTVREKAEKIAGPIPDNFENDPSDFFKLRFGIAVGSSNFLIAFKVMLLKSFELLQSMPEKKRYTAIINKTIHWIFRHGELSCDAKKEEQSRQQEKSHSLIDRYEWALSQRTDESAKILIENARLRKILDQHKIAY